MTEQEAMWVLKDFEKQVTAKADGAYQSTIGKMACDVAISALEEIQHYRELGTVEKLKVLKESALSGLELANIWAALEQLKKYEAIGTLEELREAREKQVPKKPEYKILKSLPMCPNCGEVNLVQENENGNVIYNNKFYPDCGQAIDWSMT